MEGGHPDPNGLTDPGGVWPLARPKNTKPLSHKAKATPAALSLGHRHRGAVAAALRKRYSASVLA